MKHYNPSYAEWFARLFNLKQGDQPGNEVLPYITPTVEVQPRINILRRVSLTNATAATIYTTPADKDFYLTHVTISMSKDATATVTDSNVFCIVDGVNRQILEMTSTTLTATTQSMVVSLEHPIKVDRNTAITLTANTAVANHKHAACISGYTVEVTK